MGFNERWYLNSPYEQIGQRVISVTSILNVLSKPALLPWAAKREREGLAKLWFHAHETLAHFDVANDVMDYIKEREPKYFYAKESKVALDAGSLAHGAIEFFYKIGWESSANFSAEEEFVSFIADYYGTQAGQLVSAFFRFVREHNVKILESEMTVYHPSGFGGTLDLIAEYNGELCVGDIKTGEPPRKGDAYFEAKLQTEAYRRSVKKYSPTGRFVLYLSKEKPGQYSLWYKPFGPDNEADWSAFLAAKILWERSRVKEKKP